MTALLSVQDLRVRLGRSHREVLRGVSFELQPGQRLGLIGESGSGKSVTALSVIGLLDDSAQVAGSVRLNGRELLGLSQRELAQVRGSQVTMVFQEPMTALDPTMKVGRQVAEVLLLHRGSGRAEARGRVLEVLGDRKSVV